MLIDEQCPICRKFNPAQTVQCPNCGVQLIFAGDQTRLSPEPLPALKCNDCGEGSDARSTSCGVCGVNYDGRIVYMVTLDKVSRKERTPMLSSQSTPPTQRRPRWLVPVIAAGALLLLIAVIAASIGFGSLTASRNFAQDQAATAQTNANNVQATADANAVNVRSTATAQAVSANQTATAVASSSQAEIEAAQRNADATATAAAIRIEQAEKDAADAKATAEAISQRATAQAIAHATAQADTRPAIIYDTFLSTSILPGANDVSLTTGSRYELNGRRLTMSGIEFVEVRTDIATGWIDGAALQTYMPEAMTLVAQTTSINSDLNGRGGIKIETDTYGAFTQIVPSDGGEPFVLRNGDWLELGAVNDGTATFSVYQNGDGSLTGRTGMMPVWLINGSDIPPAPTAVPTIVSGGNSGGPVKIYDAWRYKYNVGVAEVNNGHSRIKVQVVFPKGYDQYLTRSIGFVIGDSLSYGVGGGQSDVGNGGYDVRLVQFKDGGWAELSLIHVEVRNGITNVVTFTGTETKLR